MRRILNSYKVVGWGRGDSGYSFVTSRHFEYCLFTKKRLALLSMRSALSFSPKDSCNLYSASANKSECLYYPHQLCLTRKKKKAHFIEFGEIELSNEFPGIGRDAVKIQTI